MAVSSQSWGAPQVHLGEASRAPVQTREPPSVSQSPLLSLDGVAARQELGLSYRNRRLRSRGGLGFKLVSGAIASAAAVAVLIALCAAAYLRAVPLQVTRRRLSEGRAPKSTPGLVACGETSGGGPGDDPQAPLQEEKVEPQPAKKAKVEGEVSDAGDEAGSQAQTSAKGQAESTSAAAGTAVIPPEAQSYPESRLSPGEVTAAQALIALWGARAPAFPEQAARGPAFHGQAQLTPASQQQVQLPPAPQEQAQIPPAPQQRLQLTPLPQQQAQHVPALQQQVQLRPAPQQQVQLLPAPQQQLQLPPAPQRRAAAAPPLALGSVPPLFAFATFTVTVVIPSPGFVSLIPAGVAGPQSQPAPVQPAVPLPQAPRDEPLQEASSGRTLNSRKALLMSHQGLEMIDPLGQWEPPSSAQAGGAPVLEHAFSRLPRVKGGDSSQYRSFFSPQRATNNEGYPVVRTSFLRGLTNLLAQEELSSSQLGHLAAAAERLVCHLAFRETRSLAEWPGYAAEALGLRFLLLDLTVSILQLLGVPRSGPWWEQSVSHIPDEYRRSLSKWDKGLPRSNVHLMIKLTDAIRILKGGNRPAPKVLIHLKRCLFCSQNSPIRFLKRGWDPWREADRSFYQQFERSPGRSDSAEPAASRLGFRAFEDVLESQARARVKCDMFFFLRSRENQNCICPFVELRVKRCLVSSQSQAGMPGREAAFNRLELFVFCSLQSISDLDRQAAGSQEGHEETDWQLKEAGKIGVLALWCLPRKLAPSFRGSDA
ncbi:hypothetical protein Esti_004784 [Eimeria stiedai]